MGDFFSFILMLVTVILVLYGSFAFTKYLGNKTNGRSFGQNMKVIDTLMIAPEKSIVITEILGRFYILGVSNNGISIIKELEECPEIKMDIPPDSFQKSLQDVLNKCKKNTRS